MQTIPKSDAVMYTPCIAKYRHVCVCKPINRLSFQDNRISWKGNRSYRHSSCKNSLAVLAGGQISNDVTDSDRQYMRQAIDMAKQGLGKTYPNPAVGCVIVKEGKVIGQGFHPKAGEPHAEVFALRAAGKNAEDATAYVTLEPCNHFGRTPPCSRALVDAQVSRVVIGVGDPNPLVGGSGVTTLLKAGIEVAYVGGEDERTCYDINEEFMNRMKLQAGK